MYTVCRPILIQTLVLVSSCIYAQTVLTTPAVIYSNPAHTVGGELRVADSTLSSFLDIKCGTTSQACTISGKLANNGSIIITPGNVAGSSSVVVIATRLDEPTVNIRDASGTTTSTGFRMTTSTGTVYYSIQGGTDATNPGLISTRSLVPLTGSEQVGGGVGSAYFNGWYNHIDSRETDGSAPAVYARSSSGAAQRAVFAESITGSGAAGRFQARAGSSGNAVEAFTSGGGGLAVSFTGNISPTADDLYDIGNPNRIKNIFGRNADFREIDNVGLAAVFGQTAGGGALPGVWGEALTGSGPAIKASTRVGNSGPAILATSAGTGVAIHAQVGGIQSDDLGGGGLAQVCATNAGFLTIGFGCGSSASWTSYTPTLTNLSSATTTYLYQTIGHFGYFHFFIVGTSNGSNPLISLPFTPNNNPQSAACVIGSGGSFVSAWDLVAGGSQITIGLYNNTALGAGTVYSFTCNGTFEI